MSFPCTHCLSDKTSVIDSRSTTKGGIRRRRECEVCGAKFTTQEVLIDEIIEGPLIISLSGLPVDQQRAIRTLVDALAYVEEPRRAMEDA
jgi:transcriptional regulator NrdR family protein